jgi:hypothetical protein
MPVCSLKLPLVLIPRYLTSLSHFYSLLFLTFFWYVSRNLLSNSQTLFPSFPHVGSQLLDWPSLFYFPLLIRSLTIFGSTQIVWFPNSHSCLLLSFPHVNSSPTWLASLFYLPLLIHSLTIFFGFNNSSLKLLILPKLSFLGC